MNDEEIFANYQNSESTMGSDPLPPTGAETDVDTAQTGADDAEADFPVAEALALSADTDPDPDPGDPADPAPTAEERLEQLRGELNALRREMSERDSFWNRMGAECEEFYALYPDTALSALPDSVWQDVKRGIPIAAAYALAEQRKRRTEELARVSNLENGKRSAGAVGGTEPDYFSPDEVRAMSQSEVRANYQSIMRSMQKWR